MALSSATTNDVLKSNRITNYTHGMTNYNQLNSFGHTKKTKTPKQLKPSYKQQTNDNNDGKMKKSSSLHSIEKLNEDQQFISTQSISKKTGPYDKQQINLNSELLSRIEREKKIYEAKISELIQMLEIRKKDKEILSYENKNLCEKVKGMQKDLKHISGENSYLKHRIKEYGIEIEYENENKDEKSDLLNASGDTLIDGNSVTFATIGDSSSLNDQLSDDSPENASLNEGYFHRNYLKKTEDREILDSLSVSTLQDRIQKMEEDSYSTNEELQATMQELVDLQKNLDTLNEENKCLGFDRAILLESLCEQTQKLQKCRVQIDHLKYLLINTGSKDLSNLESKLQELYRISEEENTALMIQNEEFKQTILSCQNEYKELSTTIDDLREELNRQTQNHNILQEKYKEEMWQREQVEALLKNHNESFRSSVGWVDCNRGVLAVIQQSKLSRQNELNLRGELSEKSNLIEILSGEIKQLEENVKELNNTNNRRKDCKNQNFEEMQLQIKENEKELRLLNQNLDILSQKYAEDMVSCKEYERDLLTAITAANSLKEEKEKSILEMELKLETATEQMRKQFQEKSDMKNNTSCTSCNKERKISLTDRNNRATGLVIPKTPNSTVSTTNNSVKNLIQSIEDQVKAVSSTVKEPIIVQKPNHNANTVPRLGYSFKREKKDIRIDTVTNRLKEESPVSRRNSELPKIKTSSENISKLQNSQSTELSVEKSPPLTTVVNQASSILQSVSRRSSVTTAIPSDHHQLYSNSSSVKSPSPPPPCTDCLSQLVKKTNKGSKRNALLYWCQNKTAGYSKIEITNFSSSWNDGLALCALIHSCNHDLLDYKKVSDATSLNPDKSQKRINFQTAFNAAEKIGIMNQLDVETMVSVERPDWNAVMNYVTEIYQHFEIEN